MGPTQLQQQPWTPLLMISILLLLILHTYAVVDDTFILPPPPDDDVLTQEPSHVTSITSGDMTTDHMTTAITTEGSVPVTKTLSVAVEVCPLGCVCGVTFERVICANGSLYHVPTGMPPQVRHLDLSNNHIREIGHSAFTHLPHLHTLNMADNSLEYISPLAFSHMPNLHTLDLHGNQLNQSQLSPTLSQVPWVAMVNLSDNHLAGELDLSALDEMSHLEMMDLSFNHLSTVPADLFSLMPRL